MKAWGAGGGLKVQLYSLFDIDTRWGYVVIATPRPCYPLEGALSPTVQMDVNVQNLNSSSELQIHFSH